ncbi:uncharacterized protein LOC110457721 [Mizuhopecten yessoensis]|uniref:uncharacterized protein LOC110457721 n=1 Tax=Mizuhopecten yessoensis TaxID=6573 RepID=UPI000B45D98A|nr:uncharacterized protein LOC110457721 [Mizuhopecten yessoensis]
MNVLVSCLLLAFVSPGQGQAPNEGDLIEEPCVVPLTSMSGPTRFVRNTTDIVKAERGFQRDFSGSRRQIRQGELATRTKTSTWITSNQKWEDLCPERVAFISPPRWHVYQNKICYVPNPFTTFRYPTVVCTRKTCLYATGSRLYCRPDVPRIYNIPTYCFVPQSGKFVKRSFRIYTYRYCTCCHYKCPQFIMKGK